MQNRPSTTRGDTSGVFKFLVPETQSSLYRNGRVLARRDPDGSDGGLVGMDMEPRTLPVVDARRLAGAARRTLSNNGFELVRQPIEGHRPDFFEHLQVVRDYYPQCAALVARATGGRAFAFDHNIRSASGKKARRRIAGGQQVQGPAHVVHGDYTLTSGPQRLADLTRPPGGNDTLAAVLGDDEALIDAAAAERALAADGRFAIINVWRNIADEPVASHPMALCDGQTVEPEDLVVFEIHYQDRIGENYFAKFADHHRMYYYPAMTGDEALLIKQWDSAGPLARSEGARPDHDAPSDPCTFSFHSAFDDPATPADAPDRWSIEVRCMVLFD